MAKLLVMLHLPLYQEIERFSQTKQFFSHGQITRDWFLMTVQTFRSTTLMGEILWKIIPGYSQALLNQVRQHSVRIKAKSYLYPTCHHCITWINIIRTAFTKVNLTCDLIRKTLTQWFSQEIVQTESGLWLLPCGVLQCAHLYILYNIMYVVDFPVLEPLVVPLITIINFCFLDSVELKILDMVL